jgi:putative redox protein
VDKVTIVSEGAAYRHKLTARTHTLYTDATTALKGGDTASTPHELALFGLGACTAMTIEMYAATKGWQITKVTVTVTEDKVDDPDGSGTKVTRLVEDIEIEGTLTDAQLTTLKGIAKKCPVYKLFVDKKVIEANLTLKTQADATSTASADASTGAATDPGK